MLIKTDPKRVSYLIALLLASHVATLVHSTHNNTSTHRHKNAQNDDRAHTDQNSGHTSKEKTHRDDYQDVRQYSNPSDYDTNYHRNVRQNNHHTKNDGTNQLDFSILTQNNHKKLHRKTRRDDFQSYSQSQSETSQGKSYPPQDESKVPYKYGGHDGKDTQNAKLNEPVDKTGDVVLPRDEFSDDYYNNQTSTSYTITTIKISGNQQGYGSKSPFPIDKNGEERFTSLEEEMFGFDDEATTEGSEEIVAADPLFPEDLFTMEQRRHGAILFHIVGLIYMFVALAIVCDEFFVPSLDVIIEKLDIPDDVAGATFMAAGGSAPELFTSVIGVFVSFNDVGIGTIVGSAVFNILFVIGMCALFSHSVLTLTWWPLFRDCSFYSVSLITLIAFFRDSYIQWYEAAILFAIYLAYVSFMNWNQKTERWLKRYIYKNKVTRVRSTDQLMPTHQGAVQALHGNNAATSSETSVGTGVGVGLGGSVTSRAASETPGLPPHQTSISSSGGTQASGAHTGAKFRHGLLQLMIHTIDPLHDGKVDEKATQLHAIASLKVLLDATKPQNGAATSTAANQLQAASASARIANKETILIQGQQELPNGIISATLAAEANQESGCANIPEVDEDVPEALDMSWPKTGRKRLTYLLVAPIVFPLWLTLPDTRTPRGKKFFPITFLGSIMWIAAYSYLMVWWASIVGDTVGMPPEVMGLTILAAGTSIPDLITSVIVARKGFGDMAVSSSVGSNIFDVTVGLPVPWLLYAIFKGKPVKVNSAGMVCSISILFMMLLFVIMSIACFRWRMNKGLGFTMFLLYFVFVAVSLMFEYKTLSCPV